MKKFIFFTFIGIGYFTIPYLAKAGAKMLYACEWNPDAIKALQKGLELNKVDKSRYKILYGDNKKVIMFFYFDKVIIMFCFY